MRIHECSLDDLAATMGEATIDEARYMRQRLIDLRYFDTDGVPENVWLDICRQAADFARHRHGG
jgi:hypothetical protein